MNNTYNDASNRYSEIDLLDNETMSMLKEYAKGSPEIVQDIIDSYEPEGSVIIAEIKKSIAEKNPELLRISAHSLAGISGSIGAIRLKQACAETENAVKAGKTEDAFSNTNHIFNIYDELIDLLKKL
jgi:HPt (histidine-containing phosphotransfer) domain-containing protein